MLDFKKQEFEDFVVVLNLRVPFLISLGVRHHRSNSFQCYECYLNDLTHTQREAAAAKPTAVDLRVRILKQLSST